MISKINSDSPLSLGIRCTPSVSSIRAIFVISTIAASIMLGFSYHAFTNLGKTGQYIFSISTGVISIASLTSLLMLDKKFHFLGFS